MNNFVRLCFKRPICRPVYSVKRRPLSTSGQAPGTDIASIPLSQPVKGVPTPIYMNPKCDDHETKVTTLPNGLRVASENKFGQFGTIGVVIDSGSRYEVGLPAGVSHFMEKLAFNSTDEFKNRDAILHELEKHGGICDSQTSRDTTIYAASVAVGGVETAVRIMGEVILRPQLTEQEITDAGATVKFELEDHERRPDQESILTDLIHAASFKDNTVGLPKLCPADNIPKIDRRTLMTYVSRHFLPERMVLAGVGVEHEKLLEFAHKYFVDKKCVWEEELGLVLPDTKPADRSLAKFTGGLEQVEKDMSDVSLGPTPLPELAHFVLGLESCSHQDSDFVACCVLNMLMGGGGSFSAGGPGKGMYTRLYSNVLNRYGWMYNATAYNHSYADSGVFCIHASAHPNQLRDLVEVLVREFANMLGHIGTTELERAKTQLQSMLLMNLESRPVMFEDIGRQVLSSGHRKPATHYISEIGRITADDIHRFAHRMLRSKPAIAALGTLTNLPAYSDIEMALSQKEGRLPGKRFSLFRRSVKESGLKFLWL